VQALAGVGALDLDPPDGVVGRPVGGHDAVPVADVLLEPFSTTVSRR
jgi:hypothetical protein